MLKCTIKFYDRVIAYQIKEENARCLNNENKQNKQWSGSFILLLEIRKEHLSTNFTNLCFQKINFPAIPKKLLLALK